MGALRWGLVPGFAKDESIGNRMINLRAETVLQRPAFTRLLDKRRCLVPADGFYEWQVGAAGKQPMHVARRDGLPFGMAGLYERWRSAEGEVLDTCTILTTSANALLRPLHERMPVIIPPEAYARWLDVSHADIDDLLAPAPEAALRAHPVSTRVNAVRNDDATLIEPVAASPEPEPARDSSGEPPLPLQHSLL
jgi:putative SOS response-associated peptidase YedK